MFKICFNGTEWVNLVWVNMGLENVYVFVMYCIYYFYNFAVAKSGDNPLLLALFMIFCPWPEVPEVLLIFGIFT